MVVFVRSPRHAGPALARDPDDRPINVGVQLAAPLVLGEEGVESRSAGSRPRAYRKASTSTSIGGTAAQSRRQTAER
jgi:hypothetical protein